MPYIRKEDRDRLQPFTGPMQDLEIKTAGELNYLVTLLAHRFLNQKPENYQSYNDAMGALEGAKLELYRRHISSYEDDKIVENGDV
jgi:hypothetical protein